MKLGLFGGSFDPVHLGHLLVALAAREELALDRLYFIPATQSPFKSECPAAAAQERLRLLRLALAGQTWCEVDELEIRRGGISYTIDTARHFASRYPGDELFYLIGADHVAQLPKWREAGELARLVEFVVIPRPSEGIVLPTAIPNAVGAAVGNLQPVATALPAPFRGRALRGFPVGVSSSQIRKRIQKGLSIELLVPAPVAEAIRNNRLYL